MSKYDGGRAGNLAAGVDTSVYQSRLRQARVVSILIYNPTAGAINATVNIRDTGQAVNADNEVANEAVAAKGRLILGGTAGLAYLASGGIVSVKGAALGLNAYAAVEYDS